MLKRRLIIIFSSLILISCFGYRTIYGKKRIKHDKFSFDNCLHASQIDTSKLYKKVYVKSIIDNSVLVNFNPEYLKFYKNCKLGDFYSYDINDITSLQPQKADMGFYALSDGKIIITTYFDHPQGGGFRKREYIIEQIKNALILKGEKFEYKYEIIALPEEFLIYSPDW